MKVIDGKKILEDDDMVAVYKVMINHHFGLNILDGTSTFIADMTFGEFRNRSANGDFPSCDGVCDFRYDVIPYHGKENN